MVCGEVTSKERVLDFGRYAFCGIAHYVGCDVVGPHICGGHFVRVEGFVIAFENLDGGFLNGFVLENG